MNLRTRIVWLLALGRVLLPAMAATDERAHLEMQIFGIAASFPEQISLFDNVWAGDEDK
jgi:hypothetical protein